jgi:hypothetical protein
VSLEPEADQSYSLRERGIPPRQCGNGTRFRPKLGRVLIHRNCFSNRQAAAKDVCGLRRWKVRPFSSAVATSREGRRSPRSSPEVLHRTGDGAGKPAHAATATRDSVVETEPFVSGSLCASLWAYAWQQSLFSADLFQSSRSSRFWRVQSARASQSPSYSLRSFALELWSVPHHLLPIFGG